MSYSLRLIPLLPFLGATFLFLFGRSFRRQTVHLFATLAIGGACLASFDAFFLGLVPLHESGGRGAGLRDLVWTWMSSGDLRVDLAFRMDELSGVMCLIITFIGTLIHLYSTGYMSHERDHARFFAYLNLFCGAMLVLVLGDTLPVMFIGWEGVGLCSYLLIGFWYQEKANADAGKKAFITNRIGDFGFLLGMFILFHATGTFSLPEINAAAGGGVLAAPLWLGQSAAFWAALLLFVGACGKSAQIPLYVWLPDAMAGPTPVSALIHAATMVTAGVYMVVRLSAVYVLTPTVMAIVALVGAATALFAAIIGFAQNDFKKVLAYSTVSQLGFMFVGAGVGGFGNGIFHLLTHAFFKAGLFLCAGSVMHALAGSGDITRMGGLRKVTPWTHGVFLVCWLAICGIPPFSGFFSKDAIVASAFATKAFAGELAWVGPTVGVVLLAAALCTAFYMSRLYFLVFSGPFRGDAETLHHAHESPPEMVGPLVVLAAGAALTGFLGLPGALFGQPQLNLFAHWLAPVVGPEIELSHGLEIGVMLASTIIGAAGIGVAYAFFGNGYRQPAHQFAAAVPGFVSLVRDKFRVDELYGFLIVRPIRALSRGLFLVVDRLLIDRVLVHGFVFVVDVFGRLSRTFQAGDAQRYVAVFAIGMAALFYLVTRPPGELKVKVDGTAVEADASGPGGGRSDLVYGFDFDGDGEFDRQGRTPAARFVYEGSGKYKIKVVIRDPKWDTIETLRTEVRIK
jgi:NADH-quinone oxidoreductase subunit L